MKDKVLSKSIELIKLLSRNRKRPQLPIVFTWSIWCSLNDVMSVYDIAKKADSYLLCVFMLILCTITFILSLSSAYMFFWFMWQAIYDLIDYIRGDYNA